LCQLQGFVTAVINRYDRNIKVFIYTDNLYINKIFANKSSSLCVRVRADTFIVIDGKMLQLFVIICVVYAIIKIKNSLMRRI
jgi:hypothetical protein